jgi:hypothetical protein
LLDPGLSGTNFVGTIKQLVIPFSSMAQACRWPKNMDKAFKGVEVIDEGCDVEVVLCLLFVSQPNKTIAMLRKNMGIFTPEIKTKLRYYHIRNLSNLNNPHQNFSQISSIKWLSAGEKETSLSSELSKILLHLSTISCTSHKRFAISSRKANLKKRL